MSGYDSHLIIKKVAKFVEGRISVIPQTMERYISFTKYVKDDKISLRFIDSFRFMASSLEKLTSYLTEKCIVRKEFNNYNEQQLQLLMKKGVFPYEYLDSWERLDEGQLPPKEAFHSTLTDEDISINDYW